jgi:hypothetical protein
VRRLLAATIALGALAMAAPAGASPPSSPGNPSGTSLPSQTCTTDGATSEPGNSKSSPGSPFNETLPGTGGTHYTETSQYDVACYQVTQTGH